MKLFSFEKNDWYALLVLFFTSILTVFDLFLSPGRSENMDGIVHTMTPHLFYLAMRQGEFPITWIDGFANYGLPLGLISHQLTTYVTAFLEFVVHNPVTAFNILAFIGFFLSTLFFYFFLRIYFDPFASFAGALFFNFAPYRIINIFVRGAMPEFFGTVFIPLILIGLYLAVQKKHISGAILLTISVAALTLTHPFMLILSLFIALPYVLFLVITNKLFRFRELVGPCLLSLFASLVGIGIAGYFIIPLVLENKYFYYGLTKNHLTPNNYLSIGNYFDPNWYYFTTINVLPRGFVVNFGLPETLVIIAGLLFIFVIYLLKKPEKNTGLLLYAVGTSAVIIFFTTSLSNIFYQHIDILSSIQFPWRLLVSLSFLPALIISFFFNNIKNKTLILVFLFFICIIRFPQLYGKNYILYTPSDYTFTPLNLHATVMNPIWTGRSEDYPVEKEKASVIEGQGTVEKREEKNSLRSYVVIAQTPVRMVDYTFYFPGWNLSIDGKPAPIEYQDPKYRGVITYNVPQGRHIVVLRFEDTKVRILGKIVSLISLVIFGIFVLMRRKIGKLMLA